MECLTEDMSCALTIALVAIQLLFIITCVFVIFIYVRVSFVDILTKKYKLILQQWIKHAIYSRRGPAYSNFSLTNSTTQKPKVQEIKS